ncbi:6-bladed beta-propeller [Flavobacterium sp. LHD-85]|uniref:6-bladed beta-propeller n=1 Tax=Flavobacterium sp. LHD-85 TaxID=3071410 RepID=UPI0027DF4AB8|nr:6-bladed beta-propeller [Flavobacterium sp. LHD-85]MDQ6527672.1 6-bladed beta-propeller [Flavobacterium sp. LHD-85]
MMHLGDYKVILLLSILTLSGCMPDAKKQNVSTISIDPKTVNQEAVLSELVSEVKVITLETTPECFIEYFSEILYIDKENIIYRSGNSILFFDGKGTYKDKINSVGKGPDEYVKILNAHININDKLVYVVDIDAVKVYDFAGRFINKFAIGISPGDVIELKDGKFLVSVSQNYSEINRDELFLFNSSGNKIKSFKSKSEEIIKVSQDFMGMGFVYDIGKEVFYRDFLSDSIFEVSDKFLKPHWFIDSGKYKLDAEERLNVSKRSETLNNDKVDIKEVFESLKYFFISYSFNDNSYFTVFSKNNNKCIHKSAYTYDEEKKYDGMINFGIKNDLIKNATAFRPNYINGNIIVSAVNPVYFNVEQRKLFGCKEDGNPVLFIGKLKY